MKEQAIQKINKIGKVSSIITLIAKILVGIGIVLSLIGSVVCFVIPDSLLKMSFVGEIMVEVNYSALGFAMTQEQADLVKETLATEVIDEEEDGFSNVEITEGKVVTTGGVEDFCFTLRDLAWIYVMGLVALVMTFVTLIFIGSLCKSFRDCQSPFEENVIRRMQNLAIALIPWTIISTVTNSVTDSITNNKFNLKFTVDLGVVLVVLVVLILVYIFKYGAVLQQESDETL